MTDSPQATPDETTPPEESGLEAAVKGIAQGIAGKFKEMAGELLDDEQLEQQGIVDQLEAERRRANE